MTVGREATVGLVGAIDRLADCARDLARLAEEVSAGRELAGLAHASMDSGELAELQRSTFAATESAVAALAAARQLQDRADARVAALRSAARFSAEQVRQVLAEAGAPAPSAKAVRRWGREFIAAIVLLDLDAAVALIGGPAPAPLAFLSGLGTARDLAAWRDGDLAAGRRALAGLLKPPIMHAAPDLPAAPQPIATWLSTSGRRQLTVVMAWLTARLGERTEAAALLANVPDDALVQAELAGLKLQGGQLDDALEEARRAVEYGPEQPLAHLVLGTVTEAHGEYGNASDLYATGCGRLSVTGLLSLGQGATFLQPTALLQLQRARRLASLGLGREALGAVDAALQLGLVGTVPRAGADAYALRAQLLDQAGDHAADSAAAAMAAGHLYLQANQLDSAAEQYRAASQSSTAPTEAGFWLAHVMTIQSYPANVAIPDADLLDKASDCWDAWAARVGLPQGQLSWAYITRALIDSAPAQLAPPAALWQALLSLERCLVGMPGIPNAWAMSASYLRTLQYPAIASESADAGYAIDPSNKDVLIARYSLLADAGRYAEALQVLDRMPAADGKSAADRAWLLFHLGQAQEAVHLLDDPISDRTDLDQNLVVRALCYAAIGQFEEALRDLGEVVRLAQVDRSSGYRRAYANAARGDIRAAERELEILAASPDEIVTGCYSHAVIACVEFAKHDLTRASTEISQALATAGTVTDADNAIINCTQLLRLLEYRGADVRDAREILQRARASNEHSLVPPAAADELSAARSGLAFGSTARTTMDAIHARRLGQAGDLAGAAVVYEQLRSGLFEPQASAGLAGVLTRQIGDAVGLGQVERIRPLYGRLSELLPQPYPVVEWSLAQAAAVAGRPADGLATLQRIDDSALDAPTRAAVHRGIGELALVTGDLRLAVEAFESALCAADPAAGPDRMAQVEVRIGVSLAAQRDQGGAARHFARAAELWSAAGALQPNAALRKESAVFEQHAKDAGYGDVLSAALAAADLLAAADEAPKPPPASSDA